MLTDHLDTLLCKEPVQIFCQLYFFKWPVGLFLFDLWKNYLKYIFWIWVFFGGTHIMTIFCHFFTSIFYSSIFWLVAVILIKYNWSLFLWLLYFLSLRFYPLQDHKATLLYFILEALLFYPLHLDLKQWLWGKVVTGESLYLLSLRFVNFIPKYFIYSCYCQWSCFIYFRLFIASSI